MECAADNIDLAVAEPELGPAFDGKPTPVNIVASNIYEAITADLWEYLEELRQAEPTADDFTLLDDGTMDTVIEGPDGKELRYSAESAANYRDESGALDLESFVTEVVLPEWEPTDA
jgi:hypothetical protein